MWREAAQLVLMMVEGMVVFSALLAIVLAFRTRGTSSSSAPKES